MVLFFVPSCRIVFLNNCVQQHEKTYMVLFSPKKTIILLKSLADLQKSTTFVPDNTKKAPIWLNFLWIIWIITKRILSLRCKCLILKSNSYDRPRICKRTV